jgi:hypothetical protein
MAIKGEICHEGNMYTRQNDTASILQCRRKWGNFTFSSRNIWKAMMHEKRTALSL